MKGQVRRDEVGKRQFKVGIPRECGAAVPAIEAPHKRRLPVNPSLALHDLLPRSAFDSSPAGSEAVSPGGR
jgi:hypothetical protein